MSQSASRLFTAGAIVHLLTSAAHTLGHFATKKLEPAEQALLEQMQGVGGDMLGMHFTKLQVMHCLSLYMSVLGATVGLFCLVAKGALAAQPSALRRASSLCAVSALLCSAIGFWQHIAPPAVFYAITGLLFGLAATTPNRG